MLSKNSESKPKHFDVFQNFLKQSGTNLKTMKQNQNVLMCSLIFETKAELFHLI
jgi:hypothetical protein